jgi:2-succinyl-5-enolpyruvyl-6-hydroxy-3-cyclohexene-1-carboxylate synthase
MPSSTELARAIVEALRHHGVREVVLAPGSRSAPLAYAIFEADRSGLVRLHVRVDERTARILAIGQAKAS